MVSPRTSTRREPSEQVPPNDIGVFFKEMSATDNPCYEDKDEKILDVQSSEDVSIVRTFR